MTDRTAGDTYCMAWSYLAKKLRGCMKRASNPSHPPVSRNEMASRASWQTWYHIKWSLVNYLDYEASYLHQSAPLKNKFHLSAFFSIFLEPTLFFQSLYTGSLRTKKIKWPFSIFIFIHLTDRPKNFHTKIFIIQVIKKCSPNWCVIHYRIVNTFTPPKYSNMIKCIYFCQ